MQSAGSGNPPGQDWGETSPSHLCARTVRTSDKLYRNETNHVVQGIYQRRARRIDGGDLARPSRPIRGEQDLEGAANPGCKWTFAVDSPVEHGAAVDLLNQAGEIGSVAGFQLAGSDGVIQQLSGLVARGHVLRQEDRVEFGVGKEICR